MGPIVTLLAYVWTWYNMKSNEMHWIIYSISHTEETVKPRVLRFTWSMKTTSPRLPDEIMAEIRTVLDNNNCDYEQRERWEVQVNAAFIIECPRRESETFFDKIHEYLSMINYYQIIKKSLYLLGSKR